MSELYRIWFRARHNHLANGVCCPTRSQVMLGGMIEDFEREFDDLRIFYLAENIVVAPALNND